MQKTISPHLNKQTKEEPRFHFLLPQLNTKRIKSFHLHINSHVNHQLKSIKRSTGLSVCYLLSWIPPAKSVCSPKTGQLELRPGPQTPVHKSSVIYISSWISKLLPKQRTERMKQYTRTLKIASHNSKSPSISLSNVHIAIR